MNPITQKRTAWWLDQFPELFDAAELTPRQRRNLEALRDAEERKWSGMQSDHYTSVAEQHRRDAEQAARIASELNKVLAQLLEDAQGGRIKGKAAMKRLGEIRRDLNNMRQLAEQAATGEERAWQEVADMTPATYQRVVSKRMPALFQGGRGLAHITDADLNQ